jgi:hypothetical protein
METSSGDWSKTDSRTSIDSLSEPHTYGWEVLHHHLEQIIHLRHVGLDFDPTDAANVLVQTFSVASNQSMVDHNADSYYYSIGETHCYARVAIHMLSILITSHHVEEQCDQDLFTMQKDLGTLLGNLNDIFHEIKYRQLDEHLAPAYQNVLTLVEEELDALRKFVMQYIDNAVKWRMTAAAMAKNSIEGCSFCKALDEPIDVEEKSWAKLRKSLLALLATFSMCDIALEPFGEQIDPESHVYKLCQDLQSHKLFVQILEQSHPFVHVGRKLRSLRILTQAQEKLLSWYCANVLREHINNVLDKSDCEREFEIQEDTSEYNGSPFGVDLLFSLDDGPDGRYTTALSTVGLTFKDVSDSIFKIYTLVGPKSCFLAHTDTGVPE